MLSEVSTLQSRSARAVGRVSSWGPSFQRTDIDGFILPSAGRLNQQLGSEPNMRLLEISPLCLFLRINNTSLSSSSQSPSSQPFRVLFTHNPLCHGSPLAPNLLYQLHKSPRGLFPSHSRFSRSYRASNSSPPHLFASSINQGLYSFATVYRSLSTSNQTLASGLLCGRIFAAVFHVRENGKPPIQGLWPTGRQPGRIQLHPTPPHQIWPQSAPEHPVIFPISSRPNHASCRFLWSNRVHRVQVPDACSSEYLNILPCV